MKLDLTDVARAQSWMWPRLSQCALVVQDRKDGLFRITSIVSAYQAKGCTPVYTRARSAGFLWGRKAEDRHSLAVIDAMGVLDAALAHVRRADSPSHHPV